MLKKSISIICAAILSSGMLMAGDGTVQLPNGSNQWSLVAPNDGSVHVICLPVDIDFQTLQTSLKSGQSLIVYNLVAYTDWMKTFTNGAPFIAAVKITPDEITYLAKVNGQVTSFQDYQAFKNFVLGQHFTETRGLSLKNDYLPYFQKLKAGGLYYIKSTGADLHFSITFGNASQNGGSNSSGSYFTLSTLDIAGKHFAIDSTTPKGQEEDDIDFCPNGRFKDHGLDVHKQEFTEYGSWSIENGELVLSFDNDVSVHVHFDSAPAANIQGTYSTDNERGTLEIISITDGVTDDVCAQNQSSAGVDNGSEGASGSNSSGGTTNTNGNGSNGSSNSSANGSGSSSSLQLPPSPPEINGSASSNIELETPPQPPNI